MADTPAQGDNARPSTTSAMSVETEAGPIRGGSVNTTRKGEATFQGDAPSASVTIGGDERDVSRDAHGTDTGNDSIDTEVTSAGDGASGGKEPVAEAEADGQGDGVPEDLGDYTPDDPEVTAKFDARYFTEEGKLNTSALEAEWFTNAPKDGGPKKLNEGTYKYLEERLGLSRELVDGYGQGLEALQEKRDVEFYAGAGGKDRFDAALQWGREGGYTKEQQARFNAMLAKGGQDAEDARDALMGRYSRANNKAQRDARRGPPGVPERRAANAPKDVASRGGRGGDGVQPFETREEYTKAFRAADKNDSKAMATLRKRLMASPDNVRN